MSDSRDQMISVLRESVFPTLRELGFSGSFPHFRRIRETKIDLLTFQFNRHGGSFVVEIACCGPEGFTTYWGKQIPPKKISAHDLHPNKRLRLGAKAPCEDGQWFSFESNRASVYQEIVLKLLSLIRSDAENFWRVQPVS
jgi:hypothetical protein